MPADAENETEKSKNRLMNALIVVAYMKLRGVALLQSRLIVG